MGHNLMSQRRPEKRCEVGDAVCFYTGRTVTSVTDTHSGPRLTGFNSHRV